MKHARTTWAPGHGDRARGAFTLIELLVVVAIIALLISILLPALSRAKQQSQQVLCLTNLRSMGQSAILYAQENNGVIVRAEIRYGSGLNTRALHYTGSLLKGLGIDDNPPNWTISQTGSPVAQFAYIRFIDDVKVFQCPSFPEDGVTIPPPGTQNPQGEFREQAVDYVVSSFPQPYPDQNIQQDEGGGGTAGDGFAEEAVQTGSFVSAFSISRLPREAHPSRMTYITEAHVSLPINDLRWHDAFFASQLPFGAFPRIASDRRHPGGLTMLFFDGHAEPMRLEQIDPGWSKPLDERLRNFTVMPPEFFQTP